jgi:hypothetical protein
METYIAVLVLLPADGELKTDSVIIESREVTASGETEMDAMHDGLAKLAARLGYQLKRIAK